ncbi:hypothetical protein [Reyranella sp.]|uniref:hypothetical protein n=1 Tax=Reyranella sp. TaxID=1929291 RepID=UPI003D0B1CFD
MGMLLAFAPFIAFAIVDRLAGSVEGLVAGAVVSMVLLVRDRFTPGRSPKALEIGTAVLFTGLAIYALFGAPTWSVIGVRLCVDAGLLVIVLGSMALRRPFTLQYARESVPEASWNTPEFLRVNYVITAAWAVAFAVMVIAELCLLYVPDFPRRAGVIVIIAALVAAVKFTGW